MCSEGNFTEKEQNAHISLAGKSSKLNETTRDVLMNYNISEYVDAALHQFRAEERIQKNAELNSKVVLKSPYKKDENIINPEIKSNFQAFEDEILESVYDSRKKRPLGKSRQNLAALPDVFGESRTYGKASEIGFPAYDVIFPRKSVLDVNVNAQIGHRNYVLSHGDYYPSERVNRMYNTESFHKNERFGQRTGYEQAGDFLAEPPESPIANEKQADWRRKKHPEIGKSSKRHGGVSNGVSKATKEESTYTAQHLVYEETLDLSLVKAQEIANCIRNLKRRIRKKEDIDLYELRHFCKEMDYNSTGYLHFQKLIEIISEYGLSIDTKKIGDILEFKKFIDDTGMCNYEKFIDFLESEEPIVLHQKLNCKKTKDKNTLTTYREFSTDISTKKSSSGLLSAGLFSKRLDLECPKKQSSGFQGDVEMLGAETSVHTLISPSIPTTFGLSHRDYWLPRSKEQIRRIFTKIFKDLENEEMFDSIWEECLRTLPSETNKISVEAFKLAMKSRQ